jgi:hypothetical protein
MSQNLKSPSAADEKAKSILFHNPAPPIKKLELSKFLTI